MIKSLKQVQEVNRIMMRKMHAVCKKYNITYYYDSGSLIGAVRHHSFIPWDDDVDVLFTRKEYEKLMAVPKEEWGEDFALVSCPEAFPGTFFDFTARLFYMKESAYNISHDKIRNCGSEKYLDKIGLDCFILDNAYDNKFMQKLLVLHLTMVYGQAMGHRGVIDYSEYSLPQRIVIFLLSCIGKHRSMDKIYEEYQRICQSVKKDTTYFFPSNYMIGNICIRYRKKWFDGIVPVQVDEDWFDAPKGYHEVLTACYGNYMALPPEEERKPKHFRLDEG